MTLPVEFVSAKVYCALSASLSPMYFSRVVIVSASDSGGAVVVVVVVVVSSGAEVSAAEVSVSCVSVTVCAADSSAVPAQLLP